MAVRKQSGDEAQRATSSEYSTSRGSKRHAVPLHDPERRDGRHRGC